MHAKSWFLLLFAALAGSSAYAQAYSETYRPQFHFSRLAGSIGDPCGTIRYKNTYHLFGWDHYISPDLIYWYSSGWPMRGDDGSFAYFSGSVVVDTNNTSGLGSATKPPMVAVYTAHQNSDGRENQRISASTNYTLYYYYSNNPVLDIGFTDGFRDPDVFWDTRSNRWIMDVSMFAQHKVSYYASTNLKSWQYLGQFGPVGGRDQVWETPNLFQLPVNGDLGNKKWVQTCGMGPNKVQFFVGDFNGAQFVMAPESAAYINLGVGLEGDAFADFEGVTYGDWTATGTAFGSGPAQGTLPNQQAVSGYFGQRLVNSFLNGDSATGTLTSPPFTIASRRIAFLIGGGNASGQACINLLVNGSVVRTATGQNSEAMAWSGWDVSQLWGQTAQLQIVDNATGGWGHILVDQILFSDVLADFESGSYAGWTVTGSAFGSAPAAGGVSGQTAVSGYLGSRLANSYNGGDGATGSLRSADFTLTRNCINFLIGGGNQPGTACINLVVGGNVVCSATGQDSEILKRDGWDVSPWKGQTARIEIIDTATGGWGHIMVDHIFLSDTLMNQRVEHANWVDGGPDFYAPRAYRDYDNADSCTYWLGWMGNWEYATVVPTSWGRGAESLPRKIELKLSSRGYELVQAPLARLQQKLRQAGVALGPRKIQDTVTLPEFQPSKNTYELEAVFNLHASNQNFGLNLCVAGTNKVVVGYNAATSNLYLDRRDCGNVGFSPAFPKWVSTPFAPRAHFIKFQVFVDQSSIEVFVNDGERVITSLIFPDPSSLGIQLFSLNGATTLRSLNAWPLKSIWQ